MTPKYTLLPYTTLFRSHAATTTESSRRTSCLAGSCSIIASRPMLCTRDRRDVQVSTVIGGTSTRSEEHTYELQSRFDLVCSLLLDIYKQHQVSEIMREM